MIDRSPFAPFGGPPPPRPPSRPPWCPGRIVRLVDRRRFKIGVIIGPSSRGGKVRVCVWQNASCSWSQPQVKDTRRLQHLVMNELESRERGVIRRAQDTILARREITWKGGALAVQDIIGP